MEFKKIFGEIAKANGFESDFGGWFKNSTECIIALNIQKSNYGNYYNINIKIYVQGIFGNVYVKNKELVKKDIGDIFRREPPNYSDAINFENTMEDDVRIQKMQEMFKEFIVPFTAKALSKSGITALAEAGEIALLPAVEKEINNMI